MVHGPERKSVLVHGSDGAIGRVVDSVAPSVAEPGEKCVFGVIIGPGDESTKVLRDVATVQTNVE